MQGFAQAMQKAVHDRWTGFWSARRMRKVDRPRFECGEELAKPWVKVPLRTIRLQWHALQTTRYLFGALLDHGQCAIFL